MSTERSSTQKQSTEFSKAVMPRRIMLVIHSMRGGGSERQMSYLANELSRVATTCILTIDKVGDDAYSLLPSVERIGLGLNSERGGLIRGAIANYGRVQSLRKAIAEWRPDLVISFCDSNNIITLLACPSNIPVIISERSDPRHQKLSRPWEWLRRYSYPKCRACVVQTESVRQHFVLEKLVPAERLFVIPSAIVVPPTTSVGTAATSADKTAHPRSLVFIGRLSREKRVDRLLKAWSQLPQHHSAWRLNIVGDGAERITLQKQAAELGITGTVDWSLWSDDVWKTLANANAFCLVSQYEGFPQSMLEAMAAGVPVAVLDCSPAIRETIQDRIDGLIIENEAQIPAQLDILLTDETLRTTLGKNGAKRAREFGWQVIAPRWLDVIERVLD